MNGLNANSAADGNTVASDGYTMLEKYLNSIPSLDDNISFTAISGNKLNSTTARIAFNTNWAKENFTYGLFRSTDSIKFTKVTETTGTVNAYQYTTDDAAMPAGTVFYRVASYAAGRTDTSFSTIIKLNSTVTAINTAYTTLTGVSVYPNPSSKTIVVQHPSATGNAFIRVIASNGNIAVNKNVAIGNTQTVINIESLQSGSYIIEVVIDKKESQPRL